MKKITILLIISINIIFPKNSELNICELNFNNLINNGSLNVIDDRIILNKKNLNDKNIEKKIKSQIKEIKGNRKIAKQIRAIIKKLNNRYNNKIDYLFLELDHDSGKNKSYIYPIFYFIIDGNLYVHQKNIFNFFHQIPKNEESKYLDELLGDSYRQVLKKTTMKISLEDFTTLEFLKGNIFATELVLKSINPIINKINTLQTQLDDDLDSIKIKMVSPKYLSISRDTITTYQRKYEYEDKIDSNCYWRYINQGLTSVQALEMCARNHETVKEATGKSTVIKGTDREVGRITLPAHQIFSYKYNPETLEWDINDRKKSGSIEPKYQELKLFFNKKNTPELLTKYTSSIPHIESEYKLFYNFRPFIIKQKNNSYFIQGTVNVRMLKEAIPFWEEKLDVAFQDKYFTQIDTSKHYRKDEFYAFGETFNYEYSYEQKFVVNKETPINNLKKYSAQESIWDDQLLYKIFTSEVNMPQNIYKITGKDSFEFVVLTLSNATFADNGKFITPSYGNYIYRSRYGTPGWRQPNRYKEHKDTSILKELEVVCNNYIDNVTKTINSSEYLSVKSNKIIFSYSP